MEPIVIMMRNTQYVFVYAGEIAPNVYGWENVINGYEMDVVYDKPSGYATIMYDDDSEKHTRIAEVKGFNSLIWAVKEVMADILSMSDYEKYTYNLPVAINVYDTDLCVCGERIYRFVFKDSNHWIYTNFDYQYDRSDHWESQLFPPDVIPSTEHALQQVITGAI
jgi:hypothetical protein